MKEKHWQRIFSSTSPIFRVSKISCKWGGLPRQQLLVRSLVKSTFLKTRTTAFIIRLNRDNPKASNSKTRISQSNLCRNTRILLKLVARLNSTFLWTLRTSSSRNVSTINSKTKPRKSNWSEDKPPTTCHLITQGLENINLATFQKTTWTKSLNIGPSMSNSWSCTIIQVRKNFGPFMIMSLTTSWKNSSKRWSTVWWPATWTSI